MQQPVERQRLVKSVDVALEHGIDRDEIICALDLEPVAGKIDERPVRLLGVGSVPRESMRWLLVRQDEDPKAVKELLDQVAQLVQDPGAQAAVIEAAEVSGELLALGAAARPSL